MENGEMLISELSRRSGCHVETVRYYERIGVLPKPVRRGRYRCYRTSDVERLAFVRRARALGFTLDDVRALLRLSAANGRSACGQVRQLALTHVSDVRAKIADLTAMERVLTDAVCQCDDGQRPRCPVIESLSATSAETSIIAGGRRVTRISRPR